MTPIGLVFVGLISVALAKPGILSAPLIATLTPAAPVGLDGRVVDTAEVAVAKAAHAAAQVNERINLANAAARSAAASAIAVQPAVSQVLVAGPRILVPGAPIGPDGRVVDTAEVAVAKAAHAAAQVNERINLANEAARSVAADVTRQVVPVLTSGQLVGQVVSAARVGPDGRVQDTPEVAAAKAAHAAAQLNERLVLANEAARSSGALVAAGPAVTVPLVANTVVVPGAPIGPDGRVQDTPEVAVAKVAHAAAHVNEKLNLASAAANSADVVAVAGPALAYGRLVL